MKNQGSLCTYLLPERRKYVPVGGVFVLFCCAVYFKFRIVMISIVIRRPIRGDLILGIARAS